MKSLGLSLVIAALAACSARPGVAQHENDVLPSGPVPVEQGELFYQILIGEMAANRGDGDLAVDSYLRAATQSTDPRLAERATRVAIQLERWEAAAEAGQHWATLSPKDIDVHRLLAGVYLRSGNAVKAADTFETVLALSGQSFDTGATSVLAALQQEPDGRLAVAVAQELVTRHPDNAMGHFVHGQLAAENGDYDTALNALERSIALQSAFGRAQLARARVQVSRGETDDAIAVLRQHVSARPTDVISRQGLAQLLVEQQRADEALVELEALFEAYPDRGPLVYNLGLLALELQALTQAQRYFDRAVTLQPNRVDGYYFLGRISDFERQFEQAIEHYDRVDAGPNSFEAALRAAELSGRMEGLEQGRSRLQALRRRADPNAAVQIVMSESGLFQYHDDYDGARKTLDDGLLRFPGDADLHYARGLLLARLGDDRGFEREMRVVLEAEPDSAQALNALGYSLVDRNENLAEAERLILRAIELSPEDPAIIDSVGWLRFRQGDLPSAKRELERAYALLADSEIAAHLIEVLLLLGEDDAARIAFDEALDRDPESKLLLNLQQAYPTLLPSNVSEPSS